MAAAVNAATIDATDDTKAAGARRMERSSASGSSSRAATVQVDAVENGAAVAAAVEPQQQCK